jgi:drug/metabolite transporter (DMT)-like permease
MRQTMNGGDWARLLTLALIWGSSFLFYKLLGAELPPFTAVFGRLSLGVLGLIAILRLRGTKIALPRAEWGRFAMVGLLNCVIPFSLYFWAGQHVSSGTAAILNSTVPMWTALSAGLVFRIEGLTPRRFAGVAFGIAGVAALIGPQALFGQDLLGEAACLLAALNLGCAGPYARRIQGVRPAGMAVGSVGAAALMMLPVALIFDRPWTLPMPSGTAWIALFGIAFICTSLAYLVFFDLLARAGASNLSLVTLLVPITALVLGAVVLGERLSLAAGVGMALIFCGLAVNDGRVLRLLPSFGREPARAGAPSRRAPR